MSKEQKQYLNWISRALCNAISDITLANMTFIEMNAKNLIDYQEASAIDHYIERAMLPVQDALEYVDSLVDEPDNGGEG